MKSIAYWRATLTFASATMLGPQVCDAETLADVVALAYSSNPGLEAQRAAMRGIDENYVQARSGFGPSMSLSFNKNFNKSEVSTQTFETESATQAATITQQLYTGGRLTARLKGSEQQVRAARESLRNVEMDFLTRIVSAYSGLRRDEDIVRINTETVTALEKQLQDENDLYEERRNTLTDVEQSKARLASARTQLTSSKRQLAETRAGFVALVGQLPGKLEKEPDTAGLPNTLEEAVQIAEQRNPELRRAIYTERASRQRLAEARASRRFSLSARVTAEKSPYSSLSSQPENESVTGSLILTVPIFTGGQTSSVIRQSIQENSRDKLLVDDTRRGMVQDVAVAWERLDAARSSLSSLEAEMKASEQAFRGVRIEEKFGQRSTIEVLNAQLELQSSQAAMARGRADEYVSRVRLLAAIGALEPSTLSPGVETYDPERHFDKVRGRGMTPPELIGRVVDHFGAPLLGKAKPKQDLVLPSPNQPLTQAPETSEIQSTSDLIKSADAEMREEGFNQPAAPASNDAGAPTVPETLESPPPAKATGGQSESPLPAKQAAAPKSSAPRAAASDASQPTPITPPTKPAQPENGRASPISYSPARPTKSVLPPLTILTSSLRQRVATPDDPNSDIIRTTIYYRPFDESPPEDWALARDINSPSNLFAAADPMRNNSASDTLAAARTSPRSSEQKPRQAFAAIKPQVKL